ncbi:uncharacterized protein LOC115884470 [Sitophilus oryzae]|uniref:Uncharacterized protein LOC115884470 n=1 Tax=Sitophilus oryzae TaxID=7048 RepID=A0A6J2Y769_SITOR|nr:uncharacterized protein LOC115884470 [Sitophilus oryzae]
MARPKDGLSERKNLRDINKIHSSFSLRPDFSTDGLNVSIPASLSYKKVAQKSMFSKLLNSSILAGHYINENSFLARGHLTPQADFLLASSQYSTYFYINVAPQWQTINNGNWKSVESVVRTLSRTYGDLTVYTGTHDILTYENNHRIETRIYLALNEILPVPKYFWKIAYDPKSRKGIAFVIKNDPFTEISNNFCTDICTTAGYRNSAWKSRSGGYVWCCDVKEFRNIVHIPPLILSGNGILTNNLFKLAKALFTQNDNQ